MPAKVMCNFSMFGSPIQGLLYCGDLIQDSYYWLDTSGNLNTIDCVDGEPIDEDTDRYEYREIFKLAATGFYGTVEKKAISGSVYLYLQNPYDELNDSCVNAVLENGSLVGFALIDHR